MFRGTITFRCTSCKRIFRAPDIEYAASTLSVPQRCNHCNSIRTLPLFGPSGLISIISFDKWSGVYKSIWEKMEKE